MKKMRKKIGIQLLLALVLILLAGLSAGCQNKNHSTHTYGVWEVTQKPTCTEPGERVQTCSCGKSKKEEIAPTGHKEVKDKAKEATCTKDGLTEGSHCANCNMVFEEQKVIPAAHEEVKLRAIAATCTRAGKKEGSYCSVCDEIVVRQKKIRAKGHKFVDGACVSCKKSQPDTSAAILIDQLNEEKTANFITKKAYKGGSTISFQAYVPNEATWWAVSWTKNANQIGLYDWAEGNGVQMFVKAGSWQQCSVTLPKDNNSYYIYFVGAKGEWKGEELLIDDVQITDASGKVLGTDSFVDGVDAGLFNVVKTNPTNGQAVVYGKEICTEHESVTDKAVAATCDTAGKTAGSHCSSCGKVLKAQEDVPAIGHTWVNGSCSTCGKVRENLVAAIIVDELNENAPMSFITKEAYPGGSTVSLKGYVPQGATWWAISWTTDPANTDLYKWAVEGLGQGMNSSLGEWKDYSVTLPDDGQNYYIYVVGEKGQWNGKELLLDEFVIADKNGAPIATDDFDNGVENGIFDVIASNPSNGATVIYDKVYSDPCKDGHTPAVDAAVAPTCQNVGYTEGSHCSVCQLVLQEQIELPTVAHNYGADGACTYCQTMKKDRAVAINVDKLTESGEMNFITRSAYAGGSKVTLRAYVPEGVAWWAISWTTNPSDTDLYKWATDGLGQSQNSTPNVWKEYSVTLPDDGENYYIYIVAAKGEWNAKELLIDDVKITNKLSQVVAEDTFDDGLHSGIFKVVETDSSDVVVVREEVIGDVCMHTELEQEQGKEATCTEPGLLGRSYCKDCGRTIHEATEIQPNGHTWENNVCTVCGEKQENKVVALHMKYIREDGKSLVTKNAYPGGSKITFKALVPITGQWWGVGYYAEGSSTDIYSIASKSLNNDAKVGTWNEYTVTLPDDGQNYYIFFGGGKDDPWINNPLLIDDFVITDAAGASVLASDNFNEGFADVFDVIAMDGSNTVVELQTVVEKQTNTVAALHMKYIREDGTSLKSKQSYPGGSTVTFKAMAPITGQWWGLGYVAEGSSTDIYSIAGRNLNNDAKVGTWNEYSVTLPDDGQNYYIFFGGGKDDPWINNPLLIDDVVVKNASGTPIAEDDFEAGLTAEIFNAITEDGGNTVIATITE